MFNDPLTGHVVAVDRYHSTPAQRRCIQIRDVTCRLPGCMRPAARCDIDHTHPASEGGATSIENLASLCKSHHVMKHEKPWSVINLGDGVLEWRTPLGQVVTSEPMPYARQAHAATATGPEFRPTSQAQTAAEENSGSLDPETDTAVNTDSGFAADGAWCGDAPEDDELPPF
ncbi:HNH endonuclease signature motif containing protein [Gulosibacter chungangensis]|uniref:HNH endonuclease n=1 Tax=Gulosibacter chungangensis TaxID=979746 RepID=A0A7J5BFI3_9MICO|nr:HNH endonuclease signature motif containing protein [Gulosibacter chungangensis]KAB1644858.1 HNH endonuclease [Gulosibacter chungangensis]